MSDKNNIPGGVSAEQTENKTDVKIESVKNPGRERNIKTAPVEHTSGNEEIRVPDSSDDKSSGEKEAPRFIKTNKTPFVSASSPAEPESDTTDVDKYSDRLTVKATEKRVHTGFTGKINVYTEAHSSDTAEGRMIQDFRVEAEPVQTDESGGAEEIPTKEMTFDSEGKPEIVDVIESAPTKQIENPKGALLREIAGTANEGVRINPDQLMMEGFDSIGKKDEDAIAREQAQLSTELNKTRQQRISAFKFWNKQKTESAGVSADEKFTQVSEKKEFPPFLQKISDRFSGLNSDFSPLPGEEYTDFNERKDVFNRIVAERKSILLKLLIIGALGIALFVVDIIASVSAASDANGFFSVFGGSYTVFISVNLAAFAVCAALMAGDIKDGAFSLLKLHPKTDTALLFLMLSVLAQNICAYFTQLKLEENFHLMTPATILLCIPYLLSKLFYYDNTRQCFKAVAAKSEKSYLRRVSDEGLVAELLRDRENAGQNAVYAGKTRFISNFLARSSGSAYAGMPSSRAVLITAAVSVIAAVITAVVKQDAVYGVTALSLCFACSFPVSCLVASGSKLASENKKLSVKSSFVQSYKDARDFSVVDNIAADASDIFSAKITSCLTAKGVSDKQAQFCAAVLTSKFGGLLHNAFMETAAGLEDKFPAAEEPVYEEKLGLSAWISGCRVLLGTHALLINHNVQVPEEHIVKSFLTEAETPVYLALEGRFAAVFGVTYSSIINTDDLGMLVNNGTNLLISSFDANITENFAEKLLGLPECSVRIISASAAEKLSASKRTVTDREEAGIVFGDSFESLCRCACTAVRLDRAKKTSKLICETGAYVSLVLGMVISFTGAFSGISVILPVILQCIWTALCFIAPLLFSNPAKLSGSIKDSVHYIEPAKKTEPQAEKVEAEEEINKEAQTAENFKAAEKTEAPGEIGGNEADASVETPEQPSFAESRGAEEALPGYISQTTYDALDALADGIPGNASADVEQSEPKNVNVSGIYEAEAQPFSKPASQAFGKAKSFVGGLISRFTVKEEEEPEDEQTEKAAPGVETSEPRSFADTIPVKKQRSEDIEDESSVYRQAEEEARTRASFTPPEFPKAPYYDLTPEKPAAEPVEEKFTPPSDSTFYYSDAMFSRFEDDNIFAALHEESSSGSLKTDY